MYLDADAAFVELNQEKSTLSKEWEKNAIKKWKLSINRDSPIFACNRKVAERVKNVIPVYDKCISCKAAAHLGIP